MYYYFIWHLSNNKNIKVDRSSSLHLFDSTCTQPADLNQKRNLNFPDQPSIWFLSHLDMQILISLLPGWVLVLFLEARPGGWRSGCVCFLWHSLCLYAFPHSKLSRTRLRASWWYPIGLSSPGIHCSKHSISHISLLWSLISLTHHFLVSAYTPHHQLFHGGRELWGGNEPIFDSPCFILLELFSNFKKGTDDFRTGFGQNACYLIRKPCTTIFYFELWVYDSSQWSPTLF